MKKIFTMILFFMCITFVSANEIEVEFGDCVDGDTAKFIYNGEKITVRFLAVDTPETVHPTKEVEEYGKEASDYTCKRIKEAKEIILEFDEDSDEKDKYDRYLVWVFVDDSLLQKELINEGLASVAYLYGDYKYTDELEKAEQIAEENKIGIWNTNSNDHEITIDDETETAENSTEKEKSDDKVNEEITHDDVKTFTKKYKEYILLIGALIIVSVFNLKSKNTVKKKLKSKIKNDIKKRLK